MAPTITAERPDTADATALVTELDDYLIPLYPIESHHGLAVDQLIAQNVVFFVLRTEKGEAAACGGVKLFHDYAEVKRMYVRPQFRGRGYAKLMLDYLIEYAHSQGVCCLRLETGVNQTEAIGLYERAGFAQIGPFGEYKQDPNSLFFEKV